MDFIEVDISWNNKEWVINLDNIKVNERLFTQLESYIKFRLSQKENNKAAQENILIWAPSHFRRAPGPLSLSSRK